MRIAIALLASVALLGGSAHAAEPPCLTPPEASALAAYALPSVVTGVTKRCASTLASDAYLNREGRTLANRYAGLRTANWPGARAALLKIGSGGKGPEAQMLQRLPQESQMQIADLMIEGLISQRVPLSDCGRIDTLVSLLAPLPASNLAEAMSVLLGLAGASGKAQAGPYRLCSA
jgi:hypothetical protein